MSRPPRPSHIRILSDIAAPNRMKRQAEASAFSPVRRQRFYTPLITTKHVELRFHTANGLTKPHKTLKDLIRSIERGTVHISDCSTGVHPSLASAADDYWHVIQHSTSHNIAVLYRYCAIQEDVYITVLYNECGDIQQLMDRTTVPMITTNSKTTQFDTYQMTYMMLNHTKIHRIDLSTARPGYRGGGDGCHTAADPEAVYAAVPIALPTQTEAYRGYGGGGDVYRTAADEQGYGRVGHKAPALKVDVFHDAPDLMYERPANPIRIRSNQIVPVVAKVSTPKVAAPPKIQAETAAEYSDDPMHAVVKYLDDNGMCDAILGILIVLFLIVIAYVYWVYVSPTETDPSQTLHALCSAKTHDAGENPTQTDHCKK